MFCLWLRLGLQPPEPELIAWEYGIRSGMATLNEREAAQTASNT